MTVGAIHFVPLWYGRKLYDACLCPLDAATPNSICFYPCAGDLAQLPLAFCGPFHAPLLRRPVLVLSAKAGSCCSSVLPCPVFEPC